MSRYRAQVADALAAVRIRGATSYAWMGRASRALPAVLQAQMEDAERRAFLVACLREELYASFYCHGRVVAARWGEPQPVATDRRLAAALSAANRGRGTWQDGWTVERVDGDGAIVARPRLRVRAALSECRANGSGVVAGASVALRVPKDLPARSPGFFSIVGDAAEDDPFDAVVRVYWNLGAAAAPELVRLLSSALNGRRVPFRLKVLDHPLRFDRCDAAVLYLPARRFADARDDLTGAAAALARALGRRTPAFALELAPGVGLAEEAGGVLSFGQRRCALLADAVALAHERGVVAPDERLAIVAERFAEDGVSLDAPYREPALEGRHVL
jgi:HopA1 effector protein family